jgi:hypothetical protein
MRSRPIAESERHLRLRAEVASLGRSGPGQPVQARRIIRIFGRPGSWSGHGRPRFLKRLCGLLRAGWIRPHREPFLQAPGVAGLTS